MYRRAARDVGDHACIRRMARPRETGSGSLKFKANPVPFAVYRF
jgi:hypothetical protein